MAKAKTKTKPKTRAKVATRKPVAKAKAPAKPAARRPATMTVVPDSARTNKEIYRRFVDEVLNTGSYEVATQLLDPVVVSHSPLPEQQPGASGFIASLT